MAEDFSEGLKLIFTDAVERIDPLPQVGPKP
jgi:hypothetical protein